MNEDGCETLGDLVLIVGKLFRKMTVGGGEYLNIIEALVNFLKKIFSDGNGKEELLIYLEELLCLYRGDDEFLLLRFHE